MTYVLPFITEMGFTLILSYSMDSHIHTVCCPQYLLNATCIYCVKLMWHCGQRRDRSVVVEGLAPIKCRIISTNPVDACHLYYNPVYWLPVSIAYHRASLKHDDVIKWKHFPRNWPFVRGIHRSRWIPHTKASDAELWCLLWSASE